MGSIYCANDWHNANAEKENEPLSGNECECLLQSLLAIIHCDGGHYTTKHGIQKSVKDAIAIVINLRMDN